MVAISSAVAGIEPVEPAAITGPSACAASRCGLGLDQQRRAAPPARSRRARARIGCQVSRGDLQELERELPVAVEIAPAPARRACSQVTCASSCRPSGGQGRRRARAPRRGCWRPAAPRRLLSARSRPPIGSTSCASSMRRSSAADGRRQASVRRDRAGRRPARTTISSSSMSPIGDDARGQDGASPRSSVEEADRAPAGRRGASADRAWRPASASEFRSRPGRGEGAKSPPACR